MTWRQSVSGTIRHLLRSGKSDVRERYGATIVFSETKRVSLTAGDPKICGVNGNRYRARCGIGRLVIHRVRCLLPLILRESLLSHFAEKLERETPINRGCFSNRGL